MDFLAFREKAGPFLKQYRYVVLLLMLGVLLMLLPKKQETEPEAPVNVPESVDSLEEELARILTRIRGAGRVEVLLTEYAGSETLYQTDADRTADSLREDTVVVSDRERGESGLVRQVIPPRYMGAVVVCQGGDNPAVKLAILEAVSRATGLKSNQISVLKMK